MSIKLISTFLLLVVVATYFAFLNPDKVNVRFTQTFSVHVPQVVFLLSSALLGVLAATLFYWSHGIRSAFKNFQLKNFHRRQIEERNSLDQLYQKGKNAVIAGRGEKAQPLFEKILTKNPEHVGALYHLGVILRQIGKVEEAQKLHLKAADLAPGNIKILYGLADDYIETGQPDRGLDALEKIRKLDRSTIAPLYKMRDFYIRQKNWNKAYAIQRKILPLLHDAGELERERNKFSEIVYSKGLDLYHKGQTESAIVELKRALRENSRSLPAYVTLGDIYLELNNSKKAVKIWKSGFDNSRAPVCLQRIRKVYATPNHAKEIVKMYQGAIKSTCGPDQETFQLILGTYFLDQNEPQKTIDLLISERNHLSLAKRILLTRAYQSKNQKEEAGKTVQEIFEFARESILHYTCTACRTSLEEWSGYCPRCNTWDSVIQGLALYRIAALNSGSKEENSTKKA